MDRMRGVVAKDEQFSFKIIGIGNMIGAGDKHLFHFRFDRQRGIPDTILINRYPAVGQHFEPKFLSRAVEDITTYFPQPNLLGKKDHTDAILAKGWQMNSQLQAFIKKEFMRHLD